MPMSESIDDKINGIIKGHHETGHLRVSDGYWLAVHHLLDPKGDDRATARHDVRNRVIKREEVSILRECLNLNDFSPKRDFGIISQS